MKKFHTCEEGGAHLRICFGIFDELWKTWKIRIFKKISKKLLEISSFYTCVPKATIIWSTVPEMRNLTIFLSVWAIFCPFTLQPPTNPENQNFEKPLEPFFALLPGYWPQK